MNVPKPSANRIEKYLSARFVEENEYLRQFCIRGFEPSTNLNDSHGGQRFALQAEELDDTPVVVFVGVHGHKHHLESQTPLFL